MDESVDDDDGDNIGPLLVAFVDEKTPKMEDHQELPLPPLTLLLS